MEIGKIKIFQNRIEWRKWLSKNSKKEKEIWLAYYNKASGKKNIPYDHAVEEALCYGWIDSVVKKNDKNTCVQRFTPRRSNSNLSTLNKERILKLIKQKKMTKKGLEAVKHVFIYNGKEQKLKIPNDILIIIKKDKEIWKHFQSFPEKYKRIRIGWIEDARDRPLMFKQRLNYFLKMTAKNKKYGSIP
ncbi:MAG: YdeI/OmpD-associated family protein [Candidatus Woesearchaeota archaeon]